MLFNSFDFIVFFPIVVVLYYVLRHTYRTYLLLLASYFFYFYWEPSLVLLLFASTVIDYFCGLKIHKAKKQLTRKYFLWLSIFVNLGLLFFFKYFGFFTETTVTLLKFFGIDYNHQINTHSYNIKNILLPVGISFYTFQTMSYSIDVYRKEINAEYNFAKYALYVSFFPQLVAGPIERANRLLPQFYKQIQFKSEDIKKGLALMAWGFFLKLVVADRLGIYVDTVFSLPKDYAGIPLILGVLFFAFQLYYDFSAYSIIAIGAAKILGIDLMQNFDRPFYSKRLSEFWTKWHISLMLWLKDYLYKPLLKKKIPKPIILLIVFFSVGLWHGAGWNFVIWGLLNGFFLLFEAGTEKSRMKFISYFKIPKVISLGTWWFLGISLTFLSLVFFRAPSFDLALEYYLHIPQINNLRFNVLLYSFEIYLTFGLLIAVQIIHYFKGNDRVHELFLAHSKPVRWCLYIIFIVSIVLFSINRQNHFIYFQF